MESCPGGHNQKVFLFAGHDFGRGVHRGGTLMGHSTEITSTIAQWKPFLKSGGATKSSLSGQRLLATEKYYLLA